MLMRAVPWLGRSLRDLIAWMTYLDEHKVGLLSLHEAIDTSTPSGKLTFHLFGALAGVCTADWRIYSVYAGMGPV